MCLPSDHKPFLKERERGGGEGKKMRTQSSRSNKELLVSVHSRIINQAKRLAVFKINKASRKG